MTQQPPAGYPPVPGQPVGAPPVEVYASWIRRVAAFVIDQFAWWIVALVFGVIGGLMVAAAGGSSRLEGIVQLILYVAVLGFWLWNWGYRQGVTGSSLGKSVLRFKVVGERTGEPIGFGSSIARYFAHFLDAITFGIGYLMPLFTARRQTFADMAMDTVCLLNEPRPAPSHTPRPQVRLAFGVVVLASAAVLTVLACLAATSDWACTGGGPYPHCGPRVSLGPIAYNSWSFLDPYVQAALVPPLWTAGIFMVGRYYRATYLIVPISGIVAIMIFAQGRYDLGWEHNWFAFLACVVLTTAVCVLIGRGVTRSVAR